MKDITSYLRYLPAVSDPLSADVYIIEGDRYLYIYDVGNSPEAVQMLSDFPKEKIIVLSHPHNDHIGNVEKLTYNALYVGDATFDKIQKGTVIKDELVIDDGVRLQIKHCPSPHTGGSLIITVNNEYTLIADLFFTRQTHDTEQAQKMLDVLGTVETKYFVVSHQEAEAVFEKDELLHELSAYFQ